MDTSNPQTALHILQTLANHISEAERKGVIDNVRLEADNISKLYQSPPTLGEKVGFLIERGVSGFCPEADYSALVEADNKGKSLFNPETFMLVLESENREKIEDFMEASQTHGAVFNWDDKSLIENYNVKPSAVNELFALIETQLREEFKQEMNEALENLTTASLLGET